jgi:phospholipid transport system substrate-binding protein
MEKSEAGWKVVDVTVAGVKLVANYRNSFNSAIQQSGIDGLIKQLADKNRNPTGKKS